MNNFFKLIIVFIVVICAISFLDTAHAASKEQLVKKGNALFSAGKYDEAISTYDEAAVDDPESPYIYFNKGAALYKKEEYAAARDAFGQAAIKTKDIVLEAKSKFNKGLCFFREGERQKDSDLEKTLEAYGSSVQSFQEAQTLDPNFTEAAENIEMVRLMMKSVLDQIKKQEEEAKKQQAQAQKTAEKIKKLIEKQKDLLKQGQSLNNKGQAKKTTDGSANQNTNMSSQQNRDIANAQEKLKNEAQNLSEQLAKQAAPPATGSPTASSKASPASPEHPSKQHLDASVGEQEKAIDGFSKKETQAAVDHQQKSLDDLNKALEALKNDQKSQQKGQQQQQGNQQPQKKSDKNKEQKDKNSEPQSSAPEKNKPDQKQPDENQQENSVVPQPDDANNILNEEKENKKQRMPFSSKDFKKVDKDW